MEFRYLESSLITYIDTKTKKKYKDKYPHINFITEMKSDNAYEFPNIYLEELESPERGNTNEQNSTEAIKYGIQIQIADDKAKTNSKEIAYYIVSLLKEKGFIINMMPRHIKQGNIYTHLIRASRTIGCDDVI